MGSWCASLSTTYCGSFRHRLIKVRLSRHTGVSVLKLGHSDRYVYWVDVLKRTSRYCRSPAQAAPHLIHVSIKSFIYFFSSQTTLSICQVHLLQLHNNKWNITGKLERHWYMWLNCSSLSLVEPDLDATTAPTASSFQHKQLQDKVKMYI